MNVKLSLIVFWLAIGIGCSRSPWTAQETRAIEVAENAARHQMIEPGGSRFCSISEIRIVPHSGKLLVVGWVLMPNGKQQEWGSIVDPQTNSVEMSTFSSESGGDVITQMTRRLDQNIPPYRRPDVVPKP